MLSNRVNQLILICLVASFVLFAGCGGSSDQPDEVVDNTQNTQVESSVYTGGLPVIGIVNEMDVTGKKFLLIAPPVDEGMPDQKVRVSLSESVKITDKEGKELQISDFANYDTVSVDGEITETELVCDSLVQTRKTEKLPWNATNPNMKSVKDIPALIKEYLGDKLPANFPTLDWKLYNPVKHETIERGMIIELEKDSWNIYLVSNPATPEKYAITLAGDNDFTWYGKLTQEFEVTD